VDHSHDLNREFSLYLNEIQLSLIALHHLITDNWFHFLQGDAV
jgi:hypothetical protein